MLPPNGRIQHEHLLLATDTCEIPASVTGAVSLNDTGLFLMFDQHVIHFSSKLFLYTITSPFTTQLPIYNENK